MTSPAASTDRLAKPRVAGERESEILDIALDLLSEHGYDKLTYDVIAATAHASKATLYRKWPRKADLVMSALEQLHQRATGPLGERPDTGTLVGDLEAMFFGSASMLAELPQIVTAIIPALLRDAEAHEAFNERFLAPKHANLVQTLQRAQSRGEIGPAANLDLLASIIPSMNAYYVLAQGNCPDPAFVRTVIDTILLPACRASLIPADPPDPARRHP